MNLFEHEHDCKPFFKQHCERTHYVCVSIASIFISLYLSYSGAAAQSIARLFQKVCNLCICMDECV